MEGQPPSSEPDEQQYEDFSGRDISRSSILPSMPSQDRGSPDDKLRPAPQAGPSDYAQLPPGFVQPQATAGPPALDAGPGAGDVSPSLGHAQYLSAPLPLPPPVNSQATGMPLGQAYYSASTQGPGNYPGPLPPPIDSSATGMPSASMPRTGMPPAQAFPSYGQYQSPYGYGMSGQGYPYGTNPSMPYPAAGSQAGYTSQVHAGSGLGGLPGADPTYSVGWEAYSNYWSEYPQQHQGRASYGVGAGAGYGGEPPRRGVQGRSFARNPGKPYFKEGNRSDGPSGANLFVFHIPNDMNNQDLRNLFRAYGEVLSARIMTEPESGRGRGFGFVSFDNADSAARAIHFLNGYQIQGKRLKVQHKQIKPDAHGEEPRHDQLPQGYSRAPKQQRPSRHQQREALPSYPYQQYHPHQHPGPHGPRRRENRPDLSPEPTDYGCEVPPAAGFVPVQERTEPTEPPLREVGKDYSEGPTEPQREVVPPSGFVPVQEYSGLPEPAGLEVRRGQSTGPAKSHPEVLPPSGFMPTQELEGPPVPLRHGITPLLPPIAALAHVGTTDQQGAQSNTTTPLADLKDIHDALSDLSK